MVKYFLRVNSKTKLFFVYTIMKQDFSPSPLLFGIATDWVLKMSVATQTLTEHG